MQSLARLTAIVFTAGWLAACSHMAVDEPDAQVAVAAAPEPAQAAPQPGNVLLIGLDGLHPDMVARWDAPNMQALAARGVNAEAMIPVMPSVTFVNFYSIATGLYPEKHGMVANAPYDAEADEIFDRAKGPTESRWWQGEPVWITAEKQGLSSSIMFWLGSETTHDGMRPTRWTPYEHEKPYQDRVDEVLAWYDGPEEQRPRFAAVYFDRVDTAGHYFGPDAPETAAAVAEVDGYVGQLVAGLKARGLFEATTIIVVSDHGMAEIDTAKILDIGAFIDHSQITSPQFAGAFGGSAQPSIQLYGQGPALDAAFEALSNFHPNVKVWRRGEMPAHFRFDHPTRGPDLFVLADPPYTLRAANIGGWRPPIPGFHGYDSLEPMMQATFIGAGPIFPEGETQAAFENVNVYLMIACALGIEPAGTDGDPEVVERVTGGRCPAPAR